MAKETLNVGIVGAGMAGLSCATLLQAAGHQVTLFDKGRGPGGRMATRRAKVAGEMVRFDHGAQYFTARDPAFVAATLAWINAGVVAPWPAAGSEALVGTPSMNAPIKAMAEPLGVRWASRIEGVTQQGQVWVLDDGAERHTFDALVIAIPAEQVAPLLGGVAPAFAAEAQAVTSDPCWAVMAAFDSPLPLADDAVKHDGAIGFAARNSAKPDRSETHECWVIHASAEYSREILESTAEEAASLIWGRFSDQHDLGGMTPKHLAAHRWRYAKVPAKKRAVPALHDSGLKLAVAGDWLSGPRVENAFLSGQAAARALITG